jgi:phenylpyruvate tautomerase PptA (4-oxalocrotonate tautomerase family)
MPFVTLTVRKPKSTGFKDKVFAAALVATGVPDTDRFQRVLELDPADFRYDSHSPDVATTRTDDFVLIEIVWSVGRSVKVKKKLLAELMDQLRASGFDPENVMVVFKETGWENWSFAGGRILHT